MRLDGTDSTNSLRRHGFERIEVVEEPREQAGTRRKDAYFKPSASF